MTCANISNLMLDEFDILIMFLFLHISNKVHCFPSVTYKLAVSCCLCLFEFFQDDGSSTSINGQLLLMDVTSL